MGDSGKKDDEWEFKVNEEDLKASKPKKAVKASGGPGAISPEKLNSKKKKKRLEVESARTTRMTRAAIARRDTALQNYAEMMPPSPFNRLIATIIDYSLMGTIGGAAYFFQKDLHYYYVKLLAENGINQTLDPILLNRLLVGLVTFLGCMIVVILPAMYSKKTPGKSMMNIYIGHGTMGEKPSKGAIFMRELIFKPLTILSVIGVLIGLKNDGSRCLHDMITGTALYIDD